MPDGTSEDAKRAAELPSLPAKVSAMAPPAGSPAATEVPAAGEQEQAKANVQVAMAILMTAIPMLGEKSKEQDAVMEAMTKLNGVFAGKKSADLAPAEVLQVVSGLPDEYKKAMALDAAIPRGVHGAAGPNNTPGI